MASINELDSASDRRWQHKDVDRSEPRRHITDSGLKDTALDNAETLRQGAKFRQFRTAAYNQKLGG